MNKSKNKNISLDITQRTTILNRINKLDALRDKLKINSIPTLSAYLFAELKGEEYGELRKLIQDKSFFTIDTILKEEIEELKSKLMGELWKP